MPNILINPNSGILEFNTGIAGSSAFDTNLSGLRMTYDNFGAINLLSYNTNVSSGLDRFTIDGSNGRLFSVTDNLSGSLFSVNDIAGLPIIEAFDDNTVIMGAFNRNDFVLSGNSLGLGAVPNTGTTKLYVGGNVLVSGNIFISGNTVLTGVNLSSYATVSNLFATGSTLDNKINSLSGYVTGITGTFGTLPANLYSTGSILDNKINSLSGYVNSRDSLFSGQTASTGSILDNKINSLSGYVNTQDIIFSGQTFNTGSRLDNKINSLSGWSASALNLASTGSILDSKINSLSGNLIANYATITNLASTGSTLNTRINNLSGYINSSSSNIVFTTGNQTISGTKTFIQDTTFGDSAQGDFLVISGNNFTVYGSGNFTSGLFVNSSPVLTGSSTLYATTINLATTGSTLDTKINNLSGVSVLRFGDQTISGVKTFSNTGSFDTLQITNKKLSSYSYNSTNFIFGNTYINIVNSSTNITGTLPSGITSGINYYVKNLNTGILLITGSGQRTIDGFSTVNLYKNESLQLLGVNNIGYTGWVTLSADNGVS